jgi:hypothetical protein
MALLKLMLLGLVCIFNKLTYKYGSRAVWISIVSIVLILFGDILVPKLGYILHLIFESIAYGMEHLLQVNFDLTPRQAELIVAWTGIIALTCIGIRLVYKAYINLLLVLEYSKLKALITKEQMKSNPTQAFLVVSAVTFSTLGTTFLVFS